MINQKKNILINEEIPFNEIFLIAEDGEKIGLISKQDALEKAQEMNLNLVCLSPHASPPVCKIASEQQTFNLLKKRKKLAKQITKEIKITYHIGENDLNTKIKNIKKLLSKGSTIIKVNLQMKGREKEYQEESKKKCQRIIDRLYEESEGKIRLMGEIKSQDKNCYFRLFLKSNK